MVSPWKTGRPNVIHITMTETEVVCKKCSPIKYMVGFDIGVYAISMTLCEF